MQERGTVVATFSRRMRVELDSGGDVDARIKGKRLKAVCGDRVLTDRLPGETDRLIVSIDERRNALSRPNQRGDSEILAANVDQLVVTAAPTPAPDWFVVDRYLVAAESMRADAAVVFNKTELDDDEHAPAIDVYATLNYPVIRTSCEDGTGFETLADLLRDRVSIFVGQSGVGKSSIINRLIGDEQQRVADISRKHDEGRHTTVNSSLIRLATGGAVIDSPGVRDFAPFIDDPADVANGFVEIRQAAEQCRFSNCRHLKEPGCDVKARVAGGQISERRLESYRRMLRLAERIGTQRF